VFLGGLSTFLGILAFGKAFMTFFVMFVSMVVLGIIAHGLMFLPVSLSFVGPDYVVSGNKMMQSVRRLSIMSSSSMPRSRPRISSRSRCR